MKDRFDLEQEIMQCWTVVDDLKMLLEAGEVSDETINSIATLYAIKFDQCFKTFSDCCSQGFGCVDHQRVPDDHYRVDVPL
tara:strand:+ start:279 stop:521 length:243 start_codon:yes stop_codon:yes gene_type:complete